MLEMIAGVLGAINFVIPNQISDGLTYMLSNLNYLSGILPIANIMEAVGFLALFEAVWFTGKWALKIYGMIPWIGKKTTLHGGK